MVAISMLIILQLTFSGFEIAFLPQPLSAQTLEQDYEFAFRFDADRARADKLIKRGLEAYNAGDYGRAIALFDKATRMKADYGKAYFLLGKAYFKYGLPEKAYENFRAARELGYGGTALSLFIRRFSSLILKRPQIEIPLQPDYIYTFTIRGDSWKHPFIGPVDIAIDRKGRILVSCFVSKSLLIFSPTGKLLKEVKFKKTRPFGIAVGENIIYVSLFDKDSVAALSYSGKILKIIHINGTTLAGPEGIALTGNGNLLIVDSGKGRVVKITPEGKLLMTFSKRGEREDELFSPSGIAVGENGTIYISDRNALKVFDRYGNFVRIIKHPLLKRARGIKFFKGKLLIGDEISGFVLHDLRTGTWYNYNSFSYRKGALFKTEKFESVFSVALDTRGNLYIADNAQSKIHIFRIREIKRVQIFVSIDRTDARNFPTIAHYVSAYSPNLEPILSLTKENFAVSEQGIVIVPIDLSSTEYLKRKIFLAVVVQPSSERKPYFKPFMQNLFSGLPQKIYPSGRDLLVSVYKAEAVPRKVYPQNDFGTDMVPAYRAAVDWGKTELYSGEENILGSINKALRDLTNQPGVKVMLFVGENPLKNPSMDAEEWRRLLWYAKANHIRMFFAIAQRSQKLSEDARFTGGYITLMQNPKISELNNKSLFEVISSLIPEEYIITYNAPHFEREVPELWRAVKVGVKYGDLIGIDLGGYFAP